MTGIYWDYLEITTRNSRAIDPSQLLDHLIPCGLPGGSPGDRGHIPGGHSNGRHRLEAVAAERRTGPRELLCGTRGVDKLHQVHQVTWRCSLNHESGVNKNWIFDG